MQASRAANILNNIASDKEIGEGNPELPIPPSALAGTRHGKNGANSARTGTRLSGNWSPSPRES